MKKVSKPCLQLIFAHTVIRATLADFKLYNSQIWKTCWKHWKFHLTHVLKYITFDIVALNEASWDIVPRVKIRWRKGAQSMNTNAEVVTRVANSHEAGGLPGYPESKINVLKSLQSFIALYFPKCWRRKVLKCYTK